MESPVRRVSSRWVHQGRIVSLRLDEVILPKGSAATYEYVEIKHGSTTLAVEDNLDVWLVREWKYAINRYSLEVPSGGIETNEEPLAAAKRELREEAGLEASRWTSMGLVEPFTTMLNCQNYLFLAQGLTQVPVDHEEGELIEVVRMPLRDAVAKVLAGEVTHGSSAVAILKASAILLTRGHPGSVGSAANA